MSSILNSISTLQHTPTETNFFPLPLPESEEERRLRRRRWRRTNEQNNMFAVAAANQANLFGAFAPGFYNRPPTQNLLSSFPNIVENTVGEQLGEQRPVKPEEKPEVKQEEKHEEKTPRKRYPTRNRNQSSRTTTTPGGKNYIGGDEQGSFSRL